MEKSEFKDRIQTYFKCCILFEQEWEQWWAMFWITSYGVSTWSASLDLVYKRSGFIDTKLEQLEEQIKEKEIYPSTFLKFYNWLVKHKNGIWREKALWVMRASAFWAETDLNCRQRGHHQSFLGPLRPRALGCIIHTFLLFFFFFGKTKSSEEDFGLPGTPKIVLVSYQGFWALRRVQKDQFIHFTNTDFQHKKKESFF